MKVCSVEGCNRKHHAKGLCEKHYMQIRLYGKILERTMFDKNEIIFGKFFCIMKLYNSKGIEIGETYFDFEDYERIKKYKWCINSNGYVVSYMKGKIIYLTKFLLNPLKGVQIDHKNRNKLDNRRRNLRLATHQQNQINKNLSKFNKSGYSGIFISHGKWVAQIKINKKTTHIGTFASKEEAVLARINKASEIYGEFIPYENKRIFSIR